jgi:succinoglycan biosynthesis transport protein ExoP
MSRNFELLQQAGLNLTASVEIPPTLQRELGARAKKENGDSRTFAADLDRTAKEETLKLVQSVFLLQGTATNHRAVVFAAIDSGSGCSRVCVSAAQILAANISGSVCLVDANFRTPSLPLAFGTSNHYGLADALRSEKPVRGFAKSLEPNLWMVSCGSAVQESTNLLHSEQMKNRFGELRKEFDYLLIDAPPLNTYSEGFALGQLADGLVLVLEANATRRETATKVAERLNATQVKILGAVLNKRTFPIPDSLYRRL